MKITVRETCIEADAKELRETNTLADCFANMLRRVCQSFEDPDEFEDPDDDYEEEEPEE